MDVLVNQGTIRRKSRAGTVAEDAKLIADNFYAYYVLPKEEELRTEFDKREARYFFI